MFMVIGNGVREGSLTEDQAWDLAVGMASEDHMVTIADEVTGEVLSQVYIDADPQPEPVWGVV